MSLSGSAQSYIISSHEGQLMSLVSVQYCVLIRGMCDFWPPVELSPATALLLADHLFCGSVYYYSIVKYIYTVANEL